MNLDFWPPQASLHAEQVDWLIGSFGLLMALLAAPVFILSAVYLLRFRHGRHANRSEAEKGNVWLETSWAVIPFLLVLGFYVWSTRMFLDQQSPPDNALTIDVIAQQWMWKFQHAAGQREINELHVPVGRPIRLTMTSQDVIHSLYFPALRIKQDVLPGRYTYLWFTADKTGTFELMCAELCGVEHSRMTGEIVIMPQAAYARWSAAAPQADTLAKQGERLFHSLGCSGCHAPNAAVHAPDLHGLYGRPVPLAGGQTATADEAYIRDSILQPSRQIAAGYPSIMPSFRGIVSEDQLAQLIAYIKSLSAQAGQR
jgi:cytochrome c oxidase subunit 2